MCGKGCSVEYKLAKIATRWNTLSVCKMLLFVLSCVAEITETQAINDTCDHFLAQMQNMLIVILEKDAFSI